MYCRKRRGRRRRRRTGRVGLSQAIIELGTSGFQSKQNLALEYLYILCRVDVIEMEKEIEEMEEKKKAKKKSQEETTEIPTKLPIPTGTNNQYNYH